MTFSSDNHNHRASPETQALSFLTQPANMSSNLCNLRVWYQFLWVMMTNLCAPFKSRAHSSFILKADGRASGL